MSGELREAKNALLDGVSRAAGAVRSDGEIEAALAPGEEFEQCLVAAAAAGSAHGLHVEPFQDRGQERSVFAGADEGGQIAVREFPSDMFSVQVHRQGEAIVPDAIDDRLIGGAFGQFATILPFESESEREHTFQREQESGQGALMPPGGVGYDGGRGLFRLTRGAGHFRHFPF